MTITKPSLMPRLTPQELALRKSAREQYKNRGLTLVSGSTAVAVEPVSVPITPSGSHNSHGSTGNLSPMVDKMVGSAYDVVRECVYNLEYIKHVSAHLEQIYLVAKQITEGGDFAFPLDDVADPVNNGDMIFELTSNTSLTIKVKGSDGIIRKAVLPLV